MNRLKIIRMGRVGLPIIKTQDRSTDSDYTFRREKRSIIENKSNNEKIKKYSTLLPIKGKAITISFSQIPIENRLAENVASF